MTGAHQKGIRRGGRRPAYLRIAWAADSGQIGAGAWKATGLSDWDRKFLRSLAGWPLPLLEGQRAMLRSIAERAR